MKKSIWHPFSELPSRHVDLGSPLYIVITDGVFMSTALYQPLTESISSVIYDEVGPVRPWQFWVDCHFSHWCYVDDLLKYFELC